MGRVAGRAGVTIPAATAYTRDTYALSAPNSVEIMTTSDLVHEYTGITSGVWHYTAKQYIPIKPER